jgi:hypothetical protein
VLYILHCTSFQLGKIDSKRPIDDKIRWQCASESQNPRRVVEAI